MKISRKKIELWANDFFGYKNVQKVNELEQSIHLVLEIRNISMTKLEKFTRWFYEEYGFIIEEPTISGRAMLTINTKFLVQFMLPLYVIDP